MSVTIIVVVVVVVVVVIVVVVVVVVVVIVVVVFIEIILGDLSIVHGRYGGGFWFWSLGQRSVSDQSQICIQIIKQFFNERLSQNCLKMALKWSF